MLTQIQIDDFINKVISVLEELNVPYKTLDNMDGTRNGIRWNDYFYIYPVDENGKENYGNYVKFRNYYLTHYVDFKYDDVDEFIKKLYKYGEE